MPRQMNRLSARKIASLTARGYYADGGGLYLQVSQWGTKSWIFRYSIKGRTLSKKTGAQISYDMGLGSIDTITLAKARERATRARELLLDGIDPIQAREARRAQQALEDAKSITFRKCAEDYIADKRSGWKNAKHAEQWANTMRDYAYPIFGALPVQAIDTGLVVRALKPIWAEKHETATRVRSRIEAVLDAATVLGYRTGDNPARWKGHLDKILTTIEKRKRVKHHAALPFDEVADFLVAVRAQEGVAARMLEFVILTAARTGDALGATWSELDLDAAVWTIPASRMKAHREHRVPLSPQAVKLLRSLPNDGGLVFPGFKKGKPLSNMAMLVLLKRMERSDLTVHGFRSTFRDWTAERTSYPRDVCEAALAHVVGDQTEAAYRRGDLFEKRRRLMNDWARFCNTPAPKGEVIPLKSTAAA